MAALSARGFDVPGTRKVDQEGQHQRRRDASKNDPHYLLQAKLAVASLGSSDEKGGIVPGALVRMCLNVLPARTPPDLRRQSRLGGSARRHELVVGREPL
jgi:hypothetical protein